jgi:hypothetical protein
MIQPYQSMRYDHQTGYLTSRNMPSTWSDDDAFLMGVRATLNHLHGCPKSGVTALITPRRCSCLSRSTIFLRVSTYISRQVMVCHADVFCINVWYSRVSLPFSAILPPQTAYMMLCNQCPMRPRATVFFRLGQLFLEFVFVNPKLIMSSDDMPNHPSTRLHYQAHENATPILTDVRTTTLATFTFCVSIWR